MESSQRPQPPRIGVVFPQTETGPDPAAIRDFAQAVEGLDFDHLVVPEHVVGLNVDRPDRRDRSWGYTLKDPWHEPFVLFGFLAATTTRLGLVTGVLLLPQRQSALVAKQAAAVDVLSGGRLRLGVGVGGDWVETEYGVLGADFRTRGRREAEQIRLLRRLWTQPSVAFEGRWDRVPDAGINPLPVQRPIPIWLGGGMRETTTSERVLRRIGRLGDGWLATYLTGATRGADGVEAAWAKVRAYAQAAGRDPSAVGLEGGVQYGDGDLERMRRQYETWRRIGATQVFIGTAGAGLTFPGETIEALRKVKDALASW